MLLLTSNSGGPIMNMEGRVVAVAQSIIACKTDSGWDGIGLGVGSKNAKRSIDYILSAIQSKRICMQNLAWEQLN